MMQGEYGRQHNAAGFTIWMAGGGVKPRRIGATDEIGLRAVESPDRFRDLHATILPRWAWIVKSRPTCTMVARSA